MIYFIIDSPFVKKEILSPLLKYRSKGTWMILPFCNVHTRKFLPSTTTITWQGSVSPVEMSMAACEMWNGFSTTWVYRLFGSMIKPEEIIIQLILQYWTEKTAFQSLINIFISILDIYFSFENYRLLSCFSYV